MNDTPKISILAERQRILDKYPVNYGTTGKDKRFLALAICGESGELANFIKKEWRDGSDHSEAIKDEIADIRLYLELLAQIYGIEGDKLDQQVISKMKRKSESFS